MNKQAAYKIVAAAVKSVRAALEELSVLKAQIEAAGREMPEEPEFPTPEYTQRITFEGAECAVMSPEDYEALWVYAAALHAHAEALAVQNTALKAQTGCQVCQLREQEQRQRAEQAEEERQRKARAEEDARKREIERLANELTDGYEMLATFVRRFGHREEFRAVTKAIGPYLRKVA